MRFLLLSIRRIHTFDHTIDKPIGKPDNVSYYKYGLMANGISSNMADFDSMMALTNETSVTLLKMDCEGCEMDVLATDNNLVFLAEHVSRFFILKALRQKSASPRDAVST